MQWAKEMAGFDFSKVVFSDEKIWRIRPDTKQVRVWRRQGDRFTAQYCVPSTSRSVGVMVWCAINSQGDVVWERCGDYVNAQEYQRILQKHLPFIKSSNRCEIAELFIALQLTPHCVTGQRGGECSSSRMEHLPTQQGAQVIGWRGTV